LHAPRFPSVETEPPMNPLGDSPERPRDAERERVLLYGLACEWETALGGLPREDRSGMRTPLFRLEDMKTRWGTWTRDRREICLSRDLVFGHSWDSVREVLLHETAHQMADEVLGGAREPPHGPSFRKACSMLRANPGACGRCLPLDDRVDAEPADSGDPALSRVRKLLALAESPNRHEAESAMAKAHELMEKNNLDPLEREERRSFLSLFLGRPALRHGREDYALALLLQDFYFVRGIWVPAFVLEKGKMGRVLEVSGTPKNVRIAAYVHDYVRRTAESRWTDYNRDKGLNRYRKTDFVLGILRGFRCKMESGKRSGPGGPGPGKAVVRVPDPALDQYVLLRYPRVSLLYRRGAAEDSAVRADGEREGKELVIHPGILTRKTGVRRLPGPREPCE
jgi:hypothetical protein